MIEVWVMWFRKATPLSLEKQLEVLAESGIKLREHMSIDDLLKSFDREKFDSQPYLFLLTVMGGESRKEPFDDFSDAIWLLDYDRTFKHPVAGAYVKIAAKMSRLSGGTMPISDARDAINIAEGKAWLSFGLDGMPYRWDFNVTADRLDDRVLAKFADLLKLVGAGKRFFRLPLKGSDCLIGAARPDHLGQLREKTQLDFEWLG